MCLFSFSMFVLSGVMYAWLAVRKSDRDRSLPLIPVLDSRVCNDYNLGRRCVLIKLKEKLAKKKKGSGLLLVMILCILYDNLYSNGWRVYRVHIYAAGNRNAPAKGR